MKLETWNSATAREDTRPTKASPLCYRRYRCGKSPSLSLLGVPCVLGGENLRPLTTAGTADTEFFTTTIATRATPEGVGWGGALLEDASFQIQVSSYMLVLDLCQTPNPHTSTHRFEYEYEYEYE